MRVVTFGEILLRLAPIGYKRLFQSDALETSFCGAGDNVAVSLAHFGVDTGHIKRGGNHLGLYYLEKGARQKGFKGDLRSSIICYSLC
jgi:2-dehydro-3-deoxygluconokinase